MRMKVLSAKRRPFCLSLNVLSVLKGSMTALDMVENVLYSLFKSFFLYSLLIFIYLLHIYSCVLLLIIVIVYCMNAVSVIYLVMAWFPAISRYIMWSMWTWVLWFDSGCHRIIQNLTPEYNFWCGHQWPMLTHCLLPDGTKALPEPVLTYHQRCAVTFMWEQFRKEHSRYQSMNNFENYIIENTFSGPKSYTASHYLSHLKPILILHFMMSPGPNELKFAFLSVKI